LCPTIKESEMSGKKKKGGKSKKMGKPKITKGSKPKIKDLNLTLRKAAGPDDPIGACQFTDNTGQIQCVDNITKSECAKLKNSIFLVGETCD
jgi:hypothetical protein